MPLTPLALHELAEATLGCVCAALDAAAEEVEGQPGCPCRVCVVPGVPAWDSCDDPCSGEKAGGQLTVHVARIFPSAQSVFPAEAREVMGVKGCMPPPLTAAELVVTLLRCAPGPDDLGCPPACDELAAAARVLHVDSVTVYNALLCCLPGTQPNRPRGRRFVIGQQKTIGPQGGCVGIEQRAIVALPGCGVCPDEGSP